MVGTTREEIETLKQIDMIDYFIKTDKANFKLRKNGTLVYRPNENIVIWNDHSYNFGTTVKPYKDIIGTIRELYDLDFMQAINKLKSYNMQYMETPEIPKYSLFF